MRQIDPFPAQTIRPVAAAAVRSELQEHDLPPEAIQLQLRRILESRIFAQSTRLSRFLEFVVRARLCGRESELKEYVIGTDVYDRKPPYHPSTDSIVRSEARRLRGKLKEYYQQDGACDPICIYFRTGSYVPVFARASHVHGDRPPALALAQRYIAVRAFAALTGSRLEVACSRMVTHELCQKLCAGRTGRVIHLGANVPLTADLAAAGCLLVEGELAFSGNRLHIGVRLVDAGGFLFDAQQATQTVAAADVLMLGSEMAASLAARVLHMEQTAPLCANASPEMGAESRMVSDRRPALAAADTYTTTVAALASQIAKNMVRLRARPTRTSSHPAHRSSPVVEARTLMKSLYRPPRKR